LFYISKKIYEKLSVRFMRMNKSALFLAIGVTAVLAVALAPVVISSASAVPAPKQDIEERCNDPRFADRESCPGRSEEAGGGGVEDREDINTCTPRNPGQAKDCPEGSTILDPVNP
jgi:hypothetical protein